MARAAAHGGTIVIPPEHLAQLHARGWAVVALGDALRDRLLHPWSMVESLLGMPAVLLEVQPIRAVPGGRSFASSMVDTPLHTDSQQWRARPPELQLTACLRAAEHDGESLLLDGHALLAAIARDDPRLYDALLRVPRCLPFVFGDVLGPTAALRGGRCVVTHTPRPRDDDAIAPRLAAAIARSSPEVVRLNAGDVLLLDNHRVLHGRRGFDDPRRELLRVLAWLDTPLGPTPSWANVAGEVAQTIARELQDESPAVRRSFGVEDRGEPDLPTRAVAAMMAGAPPGMLSARLGVPEPQLYLWRDAIAVDLPSHRIACQRALARLAAFATPSRS
ncbi:MAG TPA: TauD/TfdA family dioxygenase [Nannocystaceae bacterium]|nr:TauD/TfdA family dioxygenase [Nannocystaceae bacterium]